MQLSWSHYLLAQSSCTKQKLISCDKSGNSDQKARIYAFGLKLSLQILVKFWNYFWLSQLGNNREANRCCIDRRCCPRNHDDQPGTGIRLFIFLIPVPLSGTVARCVKKIACHWCWTKPFMTKKVWWSLVLEPGAIFFNVNRSCLPHLFVLVFGPRKNTTADKWSEGMRNHREFDYEGDILNSCKRTELLSLIALCRLGNRKGQIITTGNYAAKRLTVCFGKYWMLLPEYYVLHAHSTSTKCISSFAVTQSNLIQRVCHKKCFRKTLLTELCFAVQKRMQLRHWLCAHQDFRQIYM